MTGARIVILSAAKNLLTSTDTVSLSDACLKVEITNLFCFKQPGIFMSAGEQKSTFAYMEGKASMSSRILVVNDDESLLELYRLLLEEEGFEVYTSFSAFEQVTEVEQMHPDLIILDAKLGFHNEGLLFLQKLRLYPGTSRIPVFICTAATLDMREQEEVLRQKNIPILYKPFDLDELLNLVQQMLMAEEAEPVPSA